MKMFSGAERLAALSRGELSYQGGHGGTCSEAGG